MKISGGKSYHDLHVYTQNIQNMTGPGAKIRTSQNSSAPDRVDLSSEGREIHMAKRIFELTPDIREDKVIEIKTQIQNGAYEINSKKIAFKMITESLINDSI